MTVAQPKEFTLWMPPSKTPNAISNGITTAGVIAIVGANGSGKTRLGTWIELACIDNKNVRRVSAQRSLQIPQHVATASLAAVDSQLEFGVDMTQFDSNSRASLQQNRESTVASHRWGNSPNTFMLNDYGYLLQYLMTHQYHDLVEYSHEQASSNAKITPPVTEIDRVQRIWENVLPHRRLKISAGALEVSDRNTEHLYNASEMSDGERVIFYLIGQCLASPIGSTIIIDEPEIHLHKSIQSRLWDAIEAERSDCLFVYLTHDLEFAASRVGARLIWLKSYDGQVWDWQEVPEVEGFPEEAMLRILGSRKPILFVEGDKGSLDYFIFSHAYPEHTIVPLIDCDTVIHATASFSRLLQLHSLNCSGIIDRDFRTDEEVNSLLSSGVHVLDQSEVENVILATPVIAAIAHYAATSGTIADAIVTISGVQQLVFDRLRKMRESLILTSSAARIEASLKRHFNAKPKSREEMVTAVTSLASLVDVNAMISTIEKQIDKALNENDYDSAIRLMNSKGLPTDICKCFDNMSNKYFIGYIKRIISGQDDESIRTAIRTVLPAL